MNNDFGHLDITESKQTLFLPLGTCQSTLQGSLRCALGKKGNVKEKQEKKPRLEHFPCEINTQERQMLP